MRAPLMMQGALNQQESIYTNNLEDLDEFMLSNIFGKDSLEKEFVGRL